MYYHAGVYDPCHDQTHWSAHTRRSQAAARREAMRMASRTGNARPVVEGWDQSHGMRPGDCDVVDFWESYLDGSWEAYDGSWRPV